MMAKMWKQFRHLTKRVLKIENCIKRHQQPFTQQKKSEGEEGNKKERQSK